MVEVKSCINSNIWSKNQIELILKGSQCSKIFKGINNCICNLWPFYSLFKLNIVYFHLKTICFNLSNVFLLFLSKSGQPWCGVGLIDFLKAIFLMLRLFHNKVIKQKHLWNYVFKFLVYIHLFPTLKISEFSTNMSDFFSLLIWVDSF